MARFARSCSTSRTRRPVDKDLPRCYHGEVKIPARAVILTLVLCALPASAQDQTEPTGKPAAAYALGDQVLSISLGPFAPLFFLANDGSTSATNLTLGGTGSIAWSAYVTGAIRVGAEVGGVFSFSPNMNVLLMLPILARAEYVLTFYPFEVPISLGIGMNIVKYGELATIDLLIKPGASAMWIYDSKWSFGLNLAWWWDMQFSKTPSQSRVGNFLELSLTALYHY
jgi:hypothetical protein